MECDLHGLTRQEAEVELRKALYVLRKRNGSRLRVIHGCGEVLSEMVYEFAEADPTITITPERDNPGSSILSVLSSYR